MGSLFMDFKNKRKMKKTVELTNQELKDLKKIRDYFGENDKTLLEHLAYDVLDRVINKLPTHNVSRSISDEALKDLYNKGYYDGYDACKDKIINKNDESIPTERRIQQFKKSYCS